MYSGNPSIEDYCLRNSGVFFQMVFKSRCSRFLTSSNCAVFIPSRTSSTILKDSTLRL